jgi:membrane protease YdiL (CAAX protease family)
MSNELDKRRVLFFLALTFGIAWAAALVTALTGGLENSRVLDAESGLTLAVLLTGTGYIIAPALAHLLTRLLTGEGWKFPRLTLQFRQGWRYLIAGWVGSLLLVIMGAAFFFLILPRFFDPALTPVRAAFPDEPYENSLIWGVLLVQTIQTALVGPFSQGLPAFAQEFGWRAYLLPRLKALGGRRAVLLTALAATVWYWPLTALGQQYGLDYPGAPWLGILAASWYTMATGIVFGWLTWRDGSLWPAVFAHAILDSVGVLLGFALLQGDPSPLLGPGAAGLLPSIPWALAAAIILIHPEAFRATGLIDPESDSKARKKKKKA